MVSFTKLAAAISTALLATTALAAPAVIAERDTDVLTFTLYKTLQAGSENQCWWGAPGNNFGIVKSSELSATSPGTCGTTSNNCHQADFYTLRIYWEAQGYNCAGIQFLIPTAK